MLSIERLKRRLGQISAYAEKVSPGTTMFVEYRVPHDYKEVVCRRLAYRLWKNQGGGFLTEQKTMRNYTKAGLVLTRALIVGELIKQGKFTL